MGTIRFTIRSDKADKQGKSPIELIYQIKGQRKKFHTKEKTWKQCWDSSIQRVIYLDRKSAKKLLSEISYDKLLTSEQVKELNNNLDRISNDILDIEKRFELDKIEYSSEMVVNLLSKQRKPFTKKEDPSNLVFDYIDKYIEENKVIREPGSLSVYRSLRNHLQSFQKEKKAKISFQKIDTSFFRQFQTFLITPHKVERKGKSVIVQLNNTTAAKQLSTLKTFLSYAKSDGLEVSPKYKDFKITKPKLEVIALTESEFETLYNHDLSGNQRLDRIRDIFCFACTTGLRYSDLLQLRREHIKGDEIKLNIKKTKTDLIIPLNPYSMAILAKYADKHYPLPAAGSGSLITNQKLNEYIKELCKLVGIIDPVEIVRSFGNKRTKKVYPKYELISIHTGRKTFVTVSLAKGMSAEETMKISGHEDYTSFKRYVNITEQQKKESMQKAWGVPVIKKPKKSTLKAV